jgi:hypothetical protein
MPAVAVAGEVRAAGGGVLPYLLGLLLALAAISHRRGIRSLRSVAKTRGLTTPSQGGDIARENTLRRADAWTERSVPRCFRPVRGLPPVACEKRRLAVGVLIVLLEWHSGKFVRQRSQSLNDSVRKVVVIGLFALQVAWIALARICGCRLAHLVIKSAA